MQLINAHVARMRIQIEYIEMPDLKLSRAQLGRLCNLPQNLCDAGVEALLRTGFLAERADGACVRSGPSRVTAPIPNPGSYAASS